MRYSELARVVKEAVASLGSLLPADQYHRLVTKDYDLTEEGPREWAQKVHRVLYNVECVPLLGSLGWSYEKIAYLRYADETREVFVTEMGPVREVARKLSSAVEGEFTLALECFEKGQRPVFGLWTLGKLLKSGMELDLDFTPTPTAEISEDWKRRHAEQNLPSPEGTTLAYGTRRKGGRS